MNPLMDLILEKKAKVGIVGLGYVGLPLALRFAEQGFDVIGFDVDVKKINSLELGESYIKHIDGKRVREQKSRILATTQFALISNCDVVILCVPTPLTIQREPDLSCITNAMQSCLPYLRSHQMLSLESTTFPGTTSEILKPMIEKKGLKDGVDFALVYSPEREDPGNERYSTANTPKVVGADSPLSLEVGLALYGTIVEQVVPVSTSRAAELTKLVENIHRCVNIALVNELKIVATKMGINIHEVLEAASTKPFGFTKYLPGPGIGGHCIPVDPSYLSWKAREFGVQTRFIDLANEVNGQMPEWVIARLQDALNHVEKSLKGSRILILGLAYKKNIDDMRESPSLQILQLASQKGALVSYCDPFVPEVHPHQEFTLSLKSLDWDPIALQSFDAIVISTDHDHFDYAALAQNGKIVIDTRGVFHGKELENVVRA
jgi:UDP-N-acetyl-D-glucosamine dehydrogenase